MRLHTLKYSLIVFVGGASYGVLATVVKLTYARGFNWMQSVASQTFSGVLIFALAFLVTIALRKRPQSLKPKQVLRLMGAGLVACATTTLFSFSLTLLPVAVTITLLFQFTWIGLIFQAASTKKRPHSAELVAAVVVVGGTLFASGFLPGTFYQSLDPLGLVCASLSALTHASFMFLSGKVETKVPPLQRGLCICCGSALIGIVLCPTYFTSGIIGEGIWLYGLGLGLSGLFVPVLLFGIATPHLPAGLATIMASSELPAAILLSVLVLQEAVDFFQICGVIVILGGVVVSQIPSLSHVRDPLPP